MFYCIVFYRFLASVLYLTFLSHVMWSIVGLEQVALVLSIYWQNENTQNYISLLTLLWIKNQLILIFYATYCNTSPNSRTTINNEGDYVVNHRGGAHLGPYNCSLAMYGDNGHTISSATYQQMISTTCRI